MHLVTQWPHADATVCLSDLPAFGTLMERRRRGRAAGKLLLRAIEADRFGRGIPPEMMLMPFEVSPWESS